MDNVCKLVLKEKLSEELIVKVKDWALLHGFGIRLKTNFDQDSLTFAPFILFPSPFPRCEFEKAVNIQPILNELMHKVANDSKFLRDALQETIKVDDFTKKLFEVYDTVEFEGRTQSLSLGLIRSDLMLETNNRNNGKTVSSKNEIRSSNESTSYGNWKQVEVNTFSAGFGWLGSLTTNLHRFVLGELDCYDKLSNLPENNAFNGLCTGMITAWDLYGKDSAIILFIVGEITYIISDQRFIEFEIRKLRPNIKIIRRTLTQIAANAKLGSNKELIIEDKYEVAVIYFREGYEPQHYPTHHEWNARLLMERSLAIKCPSIEYHLAGTKKVQEALARPQVLEKFIKNNNALEMVRSIFTGLYSLDLNAQGDNAVQMAINSPEKFVLKPQREGGGHNIFGNEIREALIQMKESDERLAWILMDKIHPPTFSGYVIKPEAETNIPQMVNLVSELGIFGVIIGDKTKIYYNKQVGHVLRTKLDSSNETGVAMGYGALDSPYLVD